MAIAIRGKRQGLLTRRQLLVRSASTLAVAGLGSLAKPYLSRAADRPLIASGIQSGDVAANSAVIWARADRPSRMRLECSTVESFASIVRTASIDALPERDLTAKLLIDGLPAGQDIFYRVRFEGFDAGHRRRNANRPFPHRAVRTPQQFPFSGPATPRGRAGASIPRAADIAPTAPCCTTVRTSSSIAATTSMRIARSSAS